MEKRVFLIVLDSFGIGAEPDAAAFGDEGTNTLGAIAGHPNFNCPNLKKLGLFNIDGVTAGEKTDAPAGAFARLQEQSMPLYNPENNACYFRISLLLDGGALWRSDLLAPGQTAPQQTLSRALAAGEYSAVLKYECFADEAETVPLNGSEIALTLRVQ